MKLTREQIEMIRTWLKKCDEGIADSNVDALCDLALLGLEAEEAPIEASADWPKWILEELGRDLRDSGWEHDSVAFVLKAIRKATQAPKENP